MFKNGRAPHTNNVELGRHGEASNIWVYPGANTFPRNGEDRGLDYHPTVKPLALVADAILDCTKRGGIVLDTFMGAGTTILAAERTGRRGFGMELDPLYVDTTIERWQRVTGIKPSTSVGRRLPRLHLRGASSCEASENQTMHRLREATPNQWKKGQTGNPTGKRPLKVDQTN